MLCGLAIRKPVLLACTLCAMLRAGGVLNPDMKGGVHLRDVLPGGDGGVLIFEPLHQAAAIGLGKESDAVARLVGLLHAGHPHAVEIGCQDVIGPAVSQPDLGAKIVCVGRG